MRTATETLLRTSEFFPTIAEIRKAAGIRSVLALYRKAYNGKCACGLEISYPESHRRGYCDVCWRGILKANALTPDDERRELEAVRGENPPALPRSGRGPEQITGSDFHA